MPASATVAMLVLAGAGLVIQNQLMVAIAGLTGNWWTPLLVNTLVGMTLIVGIGFHQHGQAFALNAVTAFRWWFILPGMFGTLFVLASVRGYAEIGAASTIALLVSAQLLTGLVVDAVRQPGAIDASLWPRFLGALLLVVGCVLISRR